MPFKNKEDRRAYDRKWSKKNHARRVKMNNKWRDKVLLWFTEYKKTLKCAMCPESTTCCLEFHHKDPKKKDLAIAEGVHNGWSIKRLMAEIAKCVVLCANCHRKVHAAVA